MNNAQGLGVVEILQQLESRTAIDPETALRWLKSILEKG
jgi:hypothetical protein